MKTKVKIGAVMAVSAIAMMGAPGMATHAWSSYHWERTTTEITVPVIDNTSGQWPARVAIAVGDWNTSKVIESGLSKGNADSSCPVVGGQIHVCNGEYGGTGWLGIASISVTRGRTTHILAGITKLNDTYFNTSDYADEAWKQLVTCQEIGHDYGLGHQNEDFRTDVTTSCMEYTSAPEGNEHPDNHDKAMLEQIYQHNHGSTDSGPTPGPGKGGGKGKKLGVVGNTPAAWGTPIKFDAQGRPNVYKRSMESFDLITHVTWAIGEGPDSHSDETGPRQHSGDRHFDF